MVTLERNQFNQRSQKSNSGVKRKQWRLITTEVAVFEPGILLPAIQVQFQYVMPVLLIWDKLYPMLLRHAL